MMLIASETDTALASPVSREAEETGADTGDKPMHKHFIHQIHKILKNKLKLKILFHYT